MPTSSPASESQRRLRFFVELRVRFVLLDGSLTGPAFVSALSGADLFVETDHPLPIGTRSRMRLYLPGRDSVDVRGIVSRHGESAEIRGMRIEFSEVSGDAAREIARYLEPKRKSFEELTSLKAVQSGGTGGTYIYARPKPVPPPLQKPAGGQAREREDKIAAESDGSEEPDEPLSSRFDPEAFQLFLGMQGKVLQFIETLDADTVRALLARDDRAKEPLRAQADLTKVPAPFESINPGMFDPEMFATDSLPLVPGVIGDPDEPLDEGERIRRKYGFDDSVFDVEQLKEKYKISEDLFGDDPAPAKPVEAAPNASHATAKTVPIPPWPDGGATPAASGAFAGAPPPPKAGSVVARLGETKEQRQACAQELRQRGEEALARGLLLKAASDLGLAVAFDADDKELGALYETVRGKANVLRADDLYRQGLQQAALGDGISASKLLLGACQIAFDRKYVISCTKILLQLKTPEALKECRSLLRTAIEKEAETVEFHVLYARVAESEGQPKAALRSYQRVLELDPEHAHAAENARRLSVEGR